MREVVPIRIGSLEGTEVSKSQVASCPRQIKPTLSYFLSELVPSKREESNVVLGVNERTHRFGL